MISKNDIEYIQNTFYNGEMMVSVKDYIKQDNVIQYTVGEWVVRFTMHADEEERLFYV